MKTKVIPAAIVLVVILLITLPAWGIGRSDNLPEFATYLKEAGLTKLYRTEIRTLCFEYDNPAACLERARILVSQREGTHAPALMDSITYRDRRDELSYNVVLARILVAVEAYKQAIETAEQVIEAMPAKDLLLEAVLVKAQCLYHLGNAGEALVNLRSIRPFVPEGSDPVLPFYLGLCEETGGNLDVAEDLFGEAEAAGSPDAALALLRLALKRGDLDDFYVMADEIGADGEEVSLGDICGLAREVEEILPEAWRTLMEPLTADSGFTVGRCPDVVSSLVRVAENGEDVSGYCETLLARPGLDRSADWLRYARALSRHDTSGCDTLALLARSMSDRDLRVRCIAWCLDRGEGEERTMFATRLLPVLSGLWGDLGPMEQEGLATLLVDSGQAKPGRDRLVRLAGDLEVGYDDAVILEVAGAIEMSGDRDEALRLYRALSESPIPSQQSLAADRAAYLLTKTGEPEEDVAGLVESVANEGASPLDLGDLFMDRLRDFDRAVSFYRRALAHPPEGVPVERVKIRMAEALAVRALETGDGDLRSEAIRLVADLADTNIVDAGDVLRTLEVATDWLRQDRGRAFSILQGLGRRQDLRSGDLYQAARLLYHLFSEHDGNVYAQCAVTLRRLSDEYPTSRQAPLGAFLAARLRFAAGDYVGALEAYKTCREVWRNHAVTKLCEEGIGDCYLYSGGFDEALGHYKYVNPSPRVTLKMGECHEICNRPDSALAYYDVALSRISPSALSAAIRLRRALLTLESDGRDAALGYLDSPLPDLRDGLRPSRRVTAAYALGRKGYRDIAMEALEHASRSDGDLACEALLLLSRLETEDESADKLAHLNEGESVCKSIFGALRLLHERAYLACSSGSPDACAKERKRYQQRFPLDLEARLSFDVHQSLIFYREGRGDTASAIIDSLNRSGEKHDALAYGLYREGIYYMVESNYEDAIRAFRDVEEEYPGSDLYYDTLLKLGTAYYVLEKYDSSAVYFDRATAAEQPSIAENAYFNLGLALEEAGRLVEASEAFRDLAIRFPFSERFERALMRTAYTLEQAGRPEEAIQGYRNLLRYAEAPETAAEAMYWIGESFAEMGRPARAACEFLRVAYLFPDAGAWTGTAAFRAGLECEKAGLGDHALIIYRENVRRFGKATDWGRASDERLEELSRPAPADGEPQGGDADGEP